MCVFHIMDGWNCKFGQFVFLRTFVWQVEKLFALFVSRRQCHNLFSNKIKWSSYIQSLVKSQATMLTTSQFVRAWVRVVTGMLSLVLTIPWTIWGKESSVSPIVTGSINTISDRSPLKHKMIIHIAMFYNTLEHGYWKYADSVF